jgi:hypothetical protein
MQFSGNKTVVLAKASFWVHNMATRIQDDNLVVLVSCTHSFERVFSYIFFFDMPYRCWFVSLSFVRFCDPLFLIVTKLPDFQLKFLYGQTMISFFIQICSKATTLSYLA